ncbi:MAG: hypothetical protein FWH18_02175 [Marinilabiliaceae bacterium]|nr:hypothetical protein [Marinilabiliaceae bacterium]
MKKKFTLPELIVLEYYKGNFALYNEGVYDIFKKDFVKNRPVFQNKKLALKSHPLIDGKEYTYYHFTHSGNIETERIPDLRRMERIGFPKPMIDFSNDNNLKVWRNKRGTRERILILHEFERYLVVLEDRKEYILPWTAYMIEDNSRLRRLIIEYQNYKKARVAVNDPVSPLTHGQ